VLVFQNVNYMFQQPVNRFELTYWGCSWSNVGTSWSCNQSFVCGKSTSLAPLCWGASDSDGGPQALCPH